ncbi:MAG: 50S ribosomal protein L23 [Phycisphaerales bacterium]|nr:50S ribosomal protein L23 [Phycisphaerales bacterium]
MNATTIIRKPIVTEKATIDSNEFNRFTFEVDRRATKAQVKRAVEELYNVRVVSVATQRRKGETRRMKHGWTTSGTIKRAIVKIHPEDSIQLF